MELMDIRSRVYFTEDTTTLFREQGQLAPITLRKNLQVMPWGADNQMPYNIIDKIAADETMATCQQFNTEVLYGGGLSLVADGASAASRQAARRFAEQNDLAAYYMGICMDFKYFGFAVSVLVLDSTKRRVVRVQRLEACNVRFCVADDTGRINRLVYANWRGNYMDGYQTYTLLSAHRALDDLRDSAPVGGQVYAVVSRIPTPDNTYYPIPYYGSLFRGKWYDIKQLIAVAKHAKLKNSAPLKYQIEISNKYWDGIFQREAITDPRKRQERIAQEKEQIIDFLTGAENAGKALFSTFYVSPNGEEQHEVIIKRIDEKTEGGDWATDIQEAINMMCFTMGVHSNLVGSVPGKSQSNNSGSDKRELYTIAQARQLPYRDLLFHALRVAIGFNGWNGIAPHCPLLQLTTLDEHTDLKVS